MKDTTSTLTNSERNMVQIRSDFREKGGNKMGFFMDDDKPMYEHRRYIYRAQIDAKAALSPMYPRLKGAICVHVSDEPGVEPVIEVLQKRGEDSGEWYDAYTMYEPSSVAKLASALDEDDKDYQKDMRDALQVLLAVMEEKGDA